jgi:hypothetical protein
MLSRLSSGIFPKTLTGMPAGSRLDAIRLRSSQSISHADVEAIRSRNRAGEG